MSGNRWACTDHFGMWCTCSSRSLKLASLHKICMMNLMWLLLWPKTCLLSNSRTPQLLAQSCTCPPRTVCTVRHRIPTTQAGKCSPSHCHSPRTSPSLTDRPCIHLRNWHPPLWNIDQQSTCHSHLVLPPYCKFLPHIVYTQYIPTHSYVFPAHIVYMVRLLGRKSPCHTCIQLHPSLPRVS